MIIEVIRNMVEIVASEYKEMKSNIISIQEEDDNSDYKFYFWYNVLMIVIFTSMATLATFLAITTVWVIVDLAGLKVLLPIIVVVAVIYAIIKTEVFYKLLYKLFKKNDKEEL